MLRKDTDESEADIQVRTREQKASSRRLKKEENDFNSLAQELVKTNQENESSVGNQEPKASEIVNNTSDIELDSQYYKQFLADDGEAEAQSQITYILPEMHLSESNVPTEQKSNIVTFPDSDQILSIPCTCSSQNLKELAEVRRTQFFLEQKIEEIKALVVCLKIDGFNNHKVLQSIKEDTSATLTHFDPREIGLATMVPEFNLPISDEDTLKEFDDKLRKDSIFNAIVVRLC